MELLFLGTGSAFTVGANNFQSNMVLTAPSGRTLLIDCGSDIRWSLHDQGLSHADIDDIYVSHLHADHVGGLEYMGFNAKYDRDCGRPRLFLSRDLTDDLWERTLSGGMRMLEGDLATLDTFFEIQEIGQSREFLWDDIRIELVRTFHVNSGFSLMPSYGLFFEIHQKRIFVTTDCQFRLDYLSEYYERADLIFQDCETAKQPTPVHAHYTQLKRLPQKIKRKMWLYGFNPGPLPDAHQDGFQGFILKGDRFDFSNAESPSNTESPSVKVV